MNEILSFGLLLAGGYLLGRFLSRFKIPAVTGYLLAGFLLGVSVINLVSYEWIGKLHWLIEFALIMVAFNVGGELSISTLKKLGKSLLWIVTFETLTTYFMMLGVIWLTSKSLPFALLIAAIGAATAPAVTVLVLNEYQADGPLSKTLLGCVGIDDAYGLVLYAISSSIAHALLGQGNPNPLVLLGTVSIEVLTSLVIGILTGWAIERMLRFSRTITESIAIVLGFLMVAGGVLEIQIKLGAETVLHFSPLLSAMAAGFFVSNFSARKSEAFRAVEMIGPPFYILYFGLAAAQLQVEKLIEMGTVALSYLFARFAGKNLGAYIGGLIGQAPEVVRRYTGLGLISQAGVAIGLSVLASSEFPHLASKIIAIAMGTTIVTELAGPFMTKYAIQKAGEAGRKFFQPGGAQNA